jgi:hypothetical protein
MVEINKSLLRLAVTVRAQLGVSSSQVRLIDLPVDTWNRCVALVRQIRRAELRGWHLAAAELIDDLRFTIPTLESQLAAGVRELPPRTAPETFSKTGDVYRDLIALTDEFDEFDFDLRGRWLSVTTEPIHLQGIYLGPFEIRLDWGRTTRSDAATYRIIAREPHPADSRGNVIHPHVMDEILCEGDGKPAIRQALVEGRLLDFFTLVAGVLRNYNPESAFVELALWYGRSCSDCGAVVDEEDCYVCQQCGESVCEGCEVTCCGCDDAFCSSCIAGCAICNDNFCRRCRRVCSRCQASVCSGCLHDNERCLKCYEEEPEGNADTAPASGGLAIQPHGLGQAVVSA